MALTATLYSFEIDLAHVDRGVYTALAFRVAQHPSEAPDFLLTRVLAYCLEYADGIQFAAQGLSGPEDPAIAIRDATGTLRTWIDIGVPDPDRLHRATKAAARVVVYTHKDPARLVRLLTGARIHRPDALELYSLDRDLLSAWVPRLTRRTTASLTIADSQVYLTLTDTSLSGAIERLTLPR